MTRRFARLCDEHVAITESLDEKSSYWLEHVSDEQYCR